MKELELKPGAEHVDLCDVMKIMGMAENGAAAKHIIATGVVKVDGAVETRKRCKIRAGQVVEYKGESVRVVG